MSRRPKLLERVRTRQGDVVLMKLPATQILTLVTLLAIIMGCGRYKTHSHTWRKSLQQTPYCVSPRLIQAPAFYGHRPTRWRTSSDIHHWRAMMWGYDCSVDSANETIFEEPIEPELLEPISAIEEQSIDLLESHDTTILWSSTRDD